jgi:hypothetical protein
MANIRTGIMMNIGGPSAKKIKEIGIIMKSPIITIINIITFFPSFELCIISTPIQIL